MLRRKIPPGGTDEDVSCPPNVRLDQYPGPIRLGRHTNCDVRCLSQKTSAERDIVNSAVSRWHAEIVRSGGGGGYIVRDKSANGTFVNGHRINGDHTLATGDVITLGMPTYKANLEPATEIVNPFIFEFAAEQDASAQSAEQPTSEPVTTHGEARPVRDRIVARVTGRRSPVPELLPQDNRETQPEDGIADLRGVGVRGVGRPVPPVPSQEGGSERGTVPMGKPLFYACSPGVHVWMNGREIQPMELVPEAGEGGKMSPITLTTCGGDGPVEVFASETNPFPRSSHRRSCGRTGPDPKVICEQASEGGDARFPLGREHVRQRMLEILRAKERADGRQEPSNKRRNPTPPLEDSLRAAKIQRPGAGDGAGGSGGSGATQAPSTPLILADECTLLDNFHSSVGGTERGQGLRSRRYNPNRDEVVDMSDSLGLPVAQGLAENETLTSQNMGRPTLDPARTEPSAVADSLGEAPPSGIVPAKDVSVDRGGEAELLEMLGEEMQCVICQNFLCAAHALPCSHTFCGDCLAQWLSKKAHCPTCRRPVGGATPTPIHNIDSMIERAANKCMSPEEKTEFDKRRGAIKSSKKLESTPATTAAAPGGAPILAARLRRPAQTLDEFRSGTLQAVSARLDEAMTSLSAERAQELVSRVQERRRMMTARRAPTNPPPPFPFGRDSGAARAPPRPSYVIDSTGAGDSRCATCNQTIAGGHCRLTETAPEAGRRYHLGCLHGQGSIHLDQISGMDALSPEVQTMVGAMFTARAPGGSSRIRPSSWI